MYIAIYVTVIVLLCAGAITFFVIRDKKNQKLGEQLKQKAKEENPAILDEKNKSFENEKVDFSKSGNTEFEENVETVQMQEGLEDFSLEMEQKVQEKPKTSFNLNPFSLDDGFTGTERKEYVSNEQKSANFEDFDEGEQGEGDDDLDRKFKEYEEFLKRNLDLDDDDLDEKNNADLDDEDRIFDNEFEDIDFDAELSTESEKNHPFDNFSNRLDDDDLRALQNFDYDSLKGKSEEEIAEIIKSLPPKAQKILISDILARRKFDDDEE